MVKYLPLNWTFWLSYWLSPHSVWYLHDCLCIGPLAIWQNLFTVMKFFRRVDKVATKYAFAFQVIILTILFLENFILYFTWQFFQYLMSNVYLCLHIVLLQHLCKEHRAISSTVYIASSHVLDDAGTIIFLFPAMF